MRMGSSGFSLIEILVVITIIGLLIAVSSGAYFKYIHYADEKLTKTRILELQGYASEYNDLRGDYPPSSLKDLNLATTGSEDNEGIEAFVQALFSKRYTGSRPDSTSDLINCDGDQADKNESEFERAELFEIRDGFEAANPIIYIRHSDYNKIFTYTFEGSETQGSESVEVRALKNPKTGTFYNFESCQIISVGQDGLFNTDDDVANFDRVD